MTASWTRIPFRRLAVLIVASTLTAAALGAPARAQIGSERYSSLVIDAASGTVVSSASPDEYRFPASLTKMMTLYMLFEAIRDRRVSLQQAVPVSAYAASMPPTKLGLQRGTFITVEQALLGLVTKSANDAAAALGEMLGGDEDRFAQIMTLRARSLGMKRTTFRNASGLPDWEQVTTARDMAILARRLIYDFPEQYSYFSTPSFVWRGRTIYNHARMLQTYPGTDGLKTGYTNASGFNLVTSTVRGDTRLIGVVLGASNSGERDLHMASLLDHGFDRSGEAPVYARREPAAPAIISVASAAPVALPRNARAPIRLSPVDLRVLSSGHRVPVVVRPQAVVARVQPIRAQTARVATPAGRRTARPAAAAVRRPASKPTSVREAPTARRPATAPAARSVPRPATSRQIRG